MISLQSKKILNTKSIVTAGLLVAISIVMKAYFSITIPLSGLPALKVGFATIPIMISGIILGPAIGFISGVIADIIGFLLASSGGAYFPGFTIAWGLFGLIPGVLARLILRNENRIPFIIINSISTIGLSIGVIWVCITKGVLHYVDKVLYYNENPVSILLILGFVLLVIIFLLTPIVVNKVTKNSNFYYSLDKILFIVAVTRIICSVIIDTYNISLIMGKGFMVFLPARLLSNFITIPLDSYIIGLIVSVLKKNKL